MRSLAIVRDRAALEQQCRRLERDAGLPPEHLTALKHALAEEAYGTVAALVESWLAASADVPVPAPPEAVTAHEDALRATVERLEQQLADREEEQAELQRVLDRFRVRYRDELGPLVSTLLRLRRDRRRQALYARRGDRQRRTAYQQATAQFERFQSMLEEIEADTPHALSEDEQDQLKAAFRRASKLCHPDRVDPAVEEEARDYFTALREAYQANDLERVEAIEQTLAESGFADRAAASISTPSQLEARAERLRKRIAAVEASIETLRGSAAYAVLTRTDDLDAYFAARKRELRRELGRLQRRRPVR